MKSSRQKYFLFVILLVCSLIVLATYIGNLQWSRNRANSCSDIQSELASDKITGVNKNLTWRKIHIGKSNKNVLLNLLGKPEKVSEIRQGHITYCLYQYIEKPDDILDSKSQIVWLSDGVVTALQFSGTDYLLSEDETATNINKIIDEYGIPETVSFSKDGPFSRTLVWLSKGIQVDVSFRQEISDDGQKIGMDRLFISGTVYFLPTDMDHYYRSPFSSYKENRGISDVVDPFPKNPFLWPER